jgi:hypothetical protein
VDQFYSRAIDKQSHQRTRASTALDKRIDDSIRKHCAKASSRTTLWESLYEDKAHQARSAQLQAKYVQAVAARNRKLSPRRGAAALKEMSDRLYGDAEKQREQQIALYQKYVHDEPQK